MKTGALQVSWGITLASGKERAELVNYRGDHLLWLNEGCNQMSDRALPSLFMEYCFYNICVCDSFWIKWNRKMKHGTESIPVSGVLRRVGPVAQHNVAAVKVFVVGWSVLSWFTSTDCSTCSFWCCVCKSPCWMTFSFWMAFPHQWFNYKKISSFIFPVIVSLNRPAHLNLRDKRRFVTAPALAVLSFLCSSVSLHQGALTYLNPLVAI